MLAGVLALALAYGAVRLVAGCALSGCTSRPRIDIATVPGPLPLFQFAQQCDPTPAQRLAPAGVQEPVMGLNAALRFYAPNDQLCPRLALARESGARIVREDFEWADIERVKGIDDWRRDDAIVDRAAEYGLTVLPILDTTPTWAGHSLWSLDFDPSAYAAFVARVVARYGPGGVFWRAHPRLAAFAPHWFELWNEPYQPAFSGGAPDPAAYARIVRSAAIAARAANPRVKLLIEADLGYFSGARYLDWIDAMYAAVPGLNRYFDGIAVHPYSSAALPPDDVSATEPEAFQTARVGAIHAAFARHGAGGRPVWITEIGWPTCTGFPACVTDAQQQEYLTQLVALARTTWRSFVTSVIVYELEDGYPGSNSADQLSYGLLQYGGAPKPAWSTFQQLAASAG